MLSVVILAAGQGTRMKSELPKIFHPVGGKAMVHHVIDAALSLDPSKVVVVLSPSLDPEKVKAGRSIEWVVQSSPQGTGDAVRHALPLIPEEDDVLILCGDTPLISPNTLKEILHKRTPGQGISVVGMRLPDPGAYGRMIVQENGRLERIIEFKDADSQERAVNLCNSGVIVAKAKELALLLSKLQPHNAAKEYYLTDIVTLGAAHGISAWAVEIEEVETLQGINTRVELAQAETHMQNRWRRAHMLNGVSLIDPSSVFFHSDTVIGQDTVIYPNVTFGPGVTIGKNVTIYPNCHISQSIIKEGAKVGPFAHLRDHVVLAEKAEVGNFVEIKNAHLGTKAKVKHLSYIGDASIGDNANVGAGTITCNYNGFSKAKTHVGTGAFIGSNTSLVAPVKVGDGAMVAAGSIITQDIPENSLGISRPNQHIKKDWANSFREKQIKVKKEC